MNKTDLKLTFSPPSDIRTEILQTFGYNGKDQKITYTTSEFSAVCPFSGLPDIATIEIVYIPSSTCIELKSLKLYFISYRSVGMYQEHVTSRIYDDLYNLLKPKYLKLTTKYATRGGIDAVCEIESSV